MWRFLVEGAPTSRLVIPVRLKTLKSNSGQMVCLTNCLGESDARTQQGYHIAFAIQVLNFPERRGGFRLTVLQSPFSLWFQLVTTELIKARRTLSWAVEALLDLERRGDRGTSNEPS